MPTNMTRPVPPPNDGIVQKQAPQSGMVKTATQQSSSGFTVQIASYSLKSEAEAQRAKLAAKGYNAGIIESHLGDKGIWYRVCIGKRLDPVSAKELAGKLGKGAIAIPDSN